MVEHDHGHVTRRCSSKLILHYNIHRWLCHIATFIKVHVALQQKSMVTWHYNILERLHYIMTSINCDVIMWHPSKYTSQWDIKKCHCHITTFIKVDVALPQSRVFSHSNGHQSLCHNVAYNNVFFRFQRSSKLMSHCDMKGFCHIATFIKVDIALRHSRVLSHCDRHQSWHCIVTFKGFITLRCS
jgi:hypothetical protein